VEGTAIAFLTTLAREAGLRIHIAHVSTALGVELVRDARARGVSLTAEACPHHLLFTSDVLKEIGPYGKINPPLRREVDRLALWRGLADGTIDAIASDHSTFTVEEKEKGWHKIWLAPPGTPSVEVLYPIVLDQAGRGCFSFNDAVNFVSTRPAMLVDLHPKKGVIQVGADADLVLYDPHASLFVDRDRWHSKAAACDRLYTGTRLSGLIRQTFVGGKCIYRDGQVVGSAGDGRFVRPIGVKAKARSQS
jgi:allantoinase